MEIVRATDAAQVEAAGPLFDDPVDPEATEHFLAEPSHHLLLAYVDDVPVGFVSGVETTHPDKRTEMFLYELGVHEAHRRCGIATALVRGLADLARERGCYGMWVLTDQDNAAALATYRSAGATELTHQVMVTWDFSSDV